jgi:hypothetical protein
MKKMGKIAITATFLIFLISSAVSAQEQAQEQEQENPFMFGLSAGLGVQSFKDGPNGEEIAYQKIGLIPEFAVGKFAVALDFSLHLSSGTGSTPFLIRTEDWVPAESTITNWAQLYLSKFVYVRYGSKGDSLYAQMGSIYNGTLGTGFIMENYTNTLFIPDSRLLGLALDIDGSLFNFPLIGMETMVANLAAWDVMGTRLFVRPLITLENEILRSMEWGVTLAADRVPNLREEYFTEISSPVNPVLMYGFDLIQPIINYDMASLALYGAMGMEPGTANRTDTAMGGMVGVGGRLIRAIPYRLQIRMLGDNFLPTYFDYSYDLYRAEKYAIIAGEDSLKGSVGFLASTGFSLFSNMIVFNVQIDGPFAPVPTTDETLKFTYSSTMYPHLAMSFEVGEGLIPGISFKAYYDKKYIAYPNDTFHPKGALIGADINYRTGPAVLTLGYDVRYNPDTDQFDTTAKLLVKAELY